MHRKGSIWAKESHYVTVPVPLQCELPGSFFLLKKLCLTEVKITQCSTVKPNSSLIHTSATPHKWMIDYSLFWLLSVYCGPDHAKPYIHG